MGLQNEQYEKLRKEYEDRINTLNEEVLSVRALLNNYSIENEDLKRRLAEIEMDRERQIEELVTI